MANKFRRMGELVGLYGMPDRVPGWTASSRTEAMRVLKAKRVVNAAGYRGALTMWRTRDGVIRAEFYSYRLVVNEVQLTTMAQAEQWLRKWWPCLDSIDASMACLNDIATAGKGGEF